jgi:hypothetical protein
VGTDRRLTGAMQGANVRGLEKARRLDELLAGPSFGHAAGPSFGHAAGPPFRHGAGSPVYVWAYGDSSGDRHLWERADRAVRVGKRRLGRR